MFLKRLKRNKLKIFCGVALSFCLSLFGIVAFSTKTYALDIDNNGITNDVQTISALSKSNLNGAYLQLYVSGGGLGDELPCRWVQNFDIKHILDYNNINFIKQNYNYTAQNNNDYKDLDINGVIYNVLNLVVNDNNTIDITYVGNNTLHLSIDYFEILNYKETVKFNLIYNNPYQNTYVPFVRIHYTLFNVPTIETNSFNNTYEFAINYKISDSQAEVYSSGAYFYLCPKSVKTKAEIKLTFSNYFGMDSYNNIIYESNAPYGNIAFDEFLSIQVNSYTNLDSSIIIDFWGNDFTSSEAYNRLLQQYNTLSDMYNSLQDDYDDLQDDYDDLLENNVPISQYDNLLNDYNMLSNTINYGIWAYLTGYVWDSSISLEGYVQFTAIDSSGTSQGSLNVPGQSTSHWSFDDLIEYNILQSGGILNMEELQNIPGYNSNYRYNIGALFNHLPTNSFYMYITNMNNVEIRISDYNDNICNLYVNANEYIFTSSSITDLVPLFQNEIYSINIINYNSNSDTTNGQINGSNNSLNAYNNGYADAKRSLSYYEQELENLEKQNNNLQNQLNETIEEKNQIYNDRYNDGYQHGYEIGANSNNALYNMVIAVADTPISIFKNIFNFNILGIDISGFVFGIISLIIIIWLIKKII